MKVHRFPDKPIRIWKAFRSHPDSLRLPLYLPSGMESIESSLRSGNVREAINELERGAALGSTPARTVLGFLHLQGALPTGVNLDRAAELLEEPVASGNAYAMYVRALLYLLREKQAPPAMRLWLDSAAQGFSPSQMAIADFLASDYPNKPGDIDGGLHSYIKAARMGHRAAPARAAWICRKHPNLIKRALAWIALPFCFGWLYLAMRADYFSDCVFQRLGEQRKAFFAEASWETDVADP